MYNRDELINYSGTTTNNFYNNNSNIIYCPRCFDFFRRDSLNGCPNCYKDLKYDSIADSIYDDIVDSTTDYSYLLIA